LATVLSQAVGAIWILRFMTGKKTILRLKLSNMKLQLPIVGPCLALGISTFVMLSTESLLSMSFTSSLAKYGGDLAVGAMTILTSVMQFALLPMQGVGQGSQPILSYNYGAGNAQRVKKTYKLLLIVSLSYSMLIWLAITRMPRVFAGIFTPDQALLEFTAKALRIYCGGLGIFGIQMACQMAFVSLGNALCSVTVAVMRKIVLLLPLICSALGAEPVLGLQLAQAVSDVLAFFISLPIGIAVLREMKAMEEKAE
jgi:Na+-driven multidrug efflux pump